MHINKETLDSMDKRFRASFVNSLSGFKPLNLIGTTDGKKENLAIFNSVFHLGADPALLGMISRPNSVRRDTIENIRKVGFYTINAVSENLYKEAHQTSARIEESEFNHCGILPTYLDCFPAPFVDLSPLKIGMKFVREIPVVENQTIMIIGSIESVYIEKSAVLDNGFIDLEVMNILAGVSLEGYYQPKKIDRLKYAKPNKDIESY